MKQIKLGIDNGNYNTKSSEHLLYASGFTMSDREFITNDMQLFYNGAYYAIGGKRMSFQQDKTKEPDSFILSLPSIAHAMKQAEVTEAEILLGVGLPIDIFGTQKQAFREYFLRGDVAFEFEGTRYHCHIADCKVFAQGHAALCRHYNALKGYTTITLVDIGGYTVDVLSLRDFKVDRGSCGSLRKGTITLFNDIRGELQRENIILSDALIGDAIAGRIQHADREKIASVTGRHVQHYYRELLNALRERGIDLKLPTVFAGGGAELLGSRLISSEVTTVDILDHFANAEGYKLLLGQ
ncbi:MAG TPA: ParM/StbA family protein [Clostridia bacterium]|nr:ParM/StbA family protein [Clostridia bacterium]